VYVCLYNCIAVCVSAKSHTEPSCTRKKIQTTLCFLKMLQEMLEKGNFVHSNSNSNCFVLPLSTFLLQKKMKIGKFETCLLTCRLRFFNQLDEELTSHQHELQWLMDKAKQIAQKDITLAPEIDKEINRLESLWEDTKKIIHEK